MCVESHKDASTIAHKGERLINYDSRCYLTGLSNKALLVASHIKSCIVSDPMTERLAPDNGLLLNALHDYRKE